MSITREERARRAAERRAANPAADDIARATRAANAADPETLAAAAHPAFVAFRPGGVVGWIVQPDGCWVWTGKFRSSPVAHLDGRTVSVARILKGRALGADLPPEVTLVRVGCTARGCVAPHHHALAWSACPHCGGAL